MLSSSPARCLSLAGAFKAIHWLLVVVLAMQGITVLMVTVRWQSDGREREEKSQSPARALAPAVTGDNDAATRYLYL